VFPPYGALAGELILGNEAVIECGGLAQGVFGHPQPNRHPEDENVSRSEPIGEDFRARWARRVYSAA
jgi:hypothetical protein